MKRFFCTRLAVVGLALGWLLAAMDVAVGSADAAEPAVADTGAAAYQQLPLRRDMDSSDMGWRMLVGLGVLAVACGFLVVRARKAGASGLPGGLMPGGGKGKTAASIEILEKRSLGATCNLYVVRWDEEEMLLACNPGEVAVVSRRPARPAARTGAS